MLAIPFIFFYYVSGHTFIYKLSKWCKSPFNNSFYCFVEDLEIIPQLLLHINMFLCKTYEMI